MYRDIRDGRGLTAFSFVVSSYVKLSKLGETSDFQDFQATTGFSFLDTNVMNM